MRSVDNIFSNSVKFLRELGPSLVEAGKKSKIPEYLQKGVEKQQMVQLSLVVMFIKI